MCTHLYVCMLTCKYPKKPPLEKIKIKERTCGSEKAKGKASKPGVFFILPKNNRRGGGTANRRADGEMSLGLRNSCEVSKDRSSAGAVGGEEGNGQFSFSRPRDCGGKKK